MKMKLVDTTVRSLKVAKVYRDNTARISAIHFAPNGEHLITAAADDYIIVYDCQTGEQRHALKSKKFGVGQIRYLHGGSSTVIHSSTKLADDSIRYLSLHDNKYLRYFGGHTAAVVSLDASPADDVFVSTALDRTLRLWDLRRPDATGVMQTMPAEGGAGGGSGRVVAAIDPEGMVFATGVNSECVRLYDMRAYAKGPFLTCRLARERAGCEWTGMKFARDGRMIVLSTNGLVVRMVDAFEAMPLQTFQGECIQEVECEIAATILCASA